MFFADSEFVPVYCGAIAVLAISLVVLLIAWMTRTAAVAAIAVGLSLVGGAVLAVAGFYVADTAGPLDLLDVVLMRMFSIAYAGLLVIGVLVSLRCWQAERRRLVTLSPKSGGPPVSVEAYNQRWVLSLLQQNARRNAEKVAMSAAASPEPLAGQGHPTPQT